MSAMFHGRACVSCAHSPGLARGSLAGTSCRGSGVPRLGEQTPDPASGTPPPPAAGHSARSLGRSSRSVLSQCLKWGVSTPAPLLPEGTPGVPPPSPEVPGGLALHCTRLPSCCPLGQSCFPTSAIWGHLPNELFTLSQICCRGTQEDRDPMGLGAQCLPVG